MKGSAFVGCATALLLANFPIAHAAPIDAIAPRDFSADLRNFNQIQRLMHNLRSRIGVPFSAMQNVGLSIQQTLQVQPLDLVLLPSGYCFSCSTPPHTEPNQSKRPNPFQNEMVELDESQLLVACTDDNSARKPDEWPLRKACPGQEKLLREFLSDVCDQGSRLAVPKARLEKAPVFQVGNRTCMPMDPKQSTCSTTPLSAHTSTLPSSTFRTETSTSRTLGDRLQDLVSSMYQYKNLSATVAPPITASTRSPTRMTVSSPLIGNGPSSTEPKASTSPISAISSSSALINPPIMAFGDGTIPPNPAHTPTSEAPPHHDDRVHSIPYLPSSLATARTSEVSSYAATSKSMKGNKSISSSSTLQSALKSTEFLSLTTKQRTAIPASTNRPEPTTDPNGSDGRRESAISAFYASLHAQQSKASEVASSTTLNLDDDPFFYPRVGPMDEEDHRQAVSILLAWRSSLSAAVASASSSADHREAMSVMGAWQSSYSAALKAASIVSASLTSNKGVNLAVTTSTARGLTAGQASSITAYVAARTIDLDVAMETSACVPTSTDDEDSSLEGSPTVLTATFPTQTKDTEVIARAACHNVPHHHHPPNAMGIPWGKILDGPPSRTTRVQRPHAPNPFILYPPQPPWPSYTTTRTGTETAHPETLAYLNAVLQNAGYPPTTDWVTTITGTFTDVRPSRCHRSPCDLKWDFTSSKYPAVASA
ncbi:hypothetical protein N431DRAFT_388038 [Stipitochalara longipes BDJ]|nr:hypothetical protein N431DRAFT_388038 [Stipitochalara longipes BDJ]